MDQEHYNLFCDCLFPPIGMLTINSVRQRLKATKKHTQYHVVCVLGGSVEISFGESNFVLKKGEAFVVPPSFEYSITSKDGYDCFDIILSVWSKRKEFIYKNIIDVTKNGLVTTSPISFNYSFSDLKELFKLPTELNCYSLNLKAEGILLNILEQINRTETNEFKIKIAEIIALNKSTFTLTELCKLSGYSQTHFERLMLQNFGCSGVEYFNKIKIERICNLLKTTNLSLRQIADRFDFYDTSHMNTFFKKRMGMTPGKYRKE